MSIGSNKNKAVTHSMRHLAAQSSKNVGAKIDTIANQLGHKSTKSTEYYAK
jgi:integrase